jgi:hypothetical protein
MMAMHPCRKPEYRLTAARIPKVDSKSRVCGVPCGILRHVSHTVRVPCTAINIGPQT